MRLDHVPALDGLRGIAVAAVVAYHLHPDLLPGGFLGVDVFFVLSGFLICSLLLREIEATGTVDVRRFYVRRVRRLMPASLLVLACVALYSATWAGLAELSRLRTHALWTLGWMANWRYVADGTAYTDLVAGSSPLRHTWSLAIEEQFYAVFPLLVLVAVYLVARRWGLFTLRKVLGWVACGGLVASVIAMTVIASHRDGIDRAYYGTDTRMQALLAGVAIATVFVGVPPRVGSVARVLRFLAIPVAVALLWFFRVGGEREPWMYRGGFTAVAVISALVIAAVNSARWLSAVLSWHPLVVLGRVSYGVYLWHWPILVVFDEQRTGLGGWRLTILRLLITAVATLLSWWCLEQPIRRGFLGRRLGAWSASVAVAGMAAVATVTVWATAIPATSPALAESGTTMSTMPAVPGADPLSVVFAGDSVAHTLAGAKVYYFPKFDPWRPGDSPFDPSRVSLWSVAKPACSYLSGLITYPTQGGMTTADLSNYCGNWKSDVQEAVRQHSADYLMVLLTIDTIDRSLDGELVSVGSPEWLPLLNDTLDDFSSAAAAGGASLVVLTPPPLEGTKTQPVQERGRRERAFTAALQAYASSHEGIAVIDFAQAVCPDFDCANAAPGFERAWRYDGRHFTIDGAKWFAQWLTPQLEQLQSSR